MSEAPCKSQCYWVGNRCQDDGNGRGLPFQRERCWGTSEDDGNGIEAYQLLRKLVVRLGLTERESVFDREVLTLDVTKIPEPSSQCLNEVGETGRREIAKTHHALLRPRRQRPRDRRAAECGQQFPPSDGDCHTPLPREVRTGRIPRHERAVLTARGGAHSRHRLRRSAARGTLGLAFKSCLLCPRKRTSAPHHGMSCECQYATSGASDGGLSVVVHLGQCDAAFAR